MLNSHFHFLNNKIAYVDQNKNTAKQLLYASMIYWNNAEMFQFA